MWSCAGAAGWGVAGTELGGGRDRELGGGRTQRAGSLQLGMQQELHRGSFRAKFGEGCGV